MSEKEIRDTIISSFVSIFGSLRANFQLTTAFNECKNIEKKHECIREALNSVKDNTELFIHKLVAIVNLHSKAIEDDLSILKRVNRTLYLLKLKYDFENKNIVATNAFTSVLFHEGEKFIQIDDNFIPDSFYKRIIQQINTCYYSETYTALMLMLRKLFENLLIDIFRKKYKNREGENLYWNAKKKQFFHFYKLIKNLESNIIDFESISKKFDKDLIRFLDKQVRTPGNKSAHTIEEIIEKRDLEEKKEEINYYCELLFSVLKKI